MVDEDPEAAARPRLEGRDDSGKIIHAIEGLHDDTLDPKIITPDALDERRVVQSLHIDPARLCDPRRVAANGHGAGRGAGGARGCRPLGPDQRYRPAVEQEGPGLKRESPASAMPVLEQHTARFNIYNRAAEAGGGVLNHQLPVRLDRGRRRGPRALLPRQHIRPVVSAAHPPTVARPFAGTGRPRAPSFTRGSERAGARAAAGPTSQNQPMTERYRPGVALLVIDIQNDFAAPEGSLYVPGGEEIIPAVNAEIEQAVAAGSPVVYTQDWHPPTTPHFSTSGGIWPPHCVRESVGARLHPMLRVDGTVVRKGTGGENGYSGFTVRDPLTDAAQATELHRILATRDITTIVVVGLAGDYCVKATALDGRALGYQVVVPLALTRFVTLQPGDDTRAIADLRDAGVVVVPDQ